MITKGKLVLGTVIVALIAITAIRVNDLTTTAAQPGYFAPDFALNDTVGKPIKLNDFRGKKVLLNFWASWCGPCKIEMPDLVKKSVRYKDEVVFLGVNTESTQSGSAALKFLNDYNAKYQNVFDTNGVVVNQCQILAYPTTLTINEVGKVVERVNGVMSEDKMESMIQRLLNK